MRAWGIHSARGAVAVAGSWRTGAAGGLPAFDARRSSNHARRRAESALLISMMMVSFRLVERLERHPDIARAFLTLQAMPCVAALAVIDLTATWYRVGCSACTVYAQIKGQAREERGPTHGGRVPALAMHVGRVAVATTHWEVSAPSAARLTTDYLAHKRGWQRTAPQPLPPTLQGLPLPLACLAIVSGAMRTAKGRCNRMRFYWAAIRL